jgi:surfeit locus 1 family protein
MVLPSRRQFLLILIALLFASLFVRLGFWQLGRRSERQALNARIESRMRQRPVTLGELPRDTSELAYRTVRVAGTLDYGRELVLTSRSYEGAPGVYLLTPLRVPGSDTAVLLNRGWVYSPDGASLELTQWRTERAVPGTDSTGDEVAIQPMLAYARSFPAPGTRAIGVRDRPHAVSGLDHAQLARRVPYPLAPYYLVALPEEAPKPDAPARIAQPELDEGPHLSYAIQWFSFATIAVVGVGVLVWSEKRSKEGTWELERGKRG